MRYNNVILHVIYQDDLIDKDPLVQRIPHLVLKGNIPLRYLKNYTKFTELNNQYPCRDYLTKVNSIQQKMWLTRMAAERLEVQKKKIDQLLRQMNYNWNQVALILLGRYFGMKANNGNFEVLLSNLPYSLLARKSHSILQLESILFGVSSLLPEDKSEEYVEGLVKEFKHQAKKYSLKPLDHLDWKFMRVRPVNFPTVRIAQLAQLVHLWPNTMTKILSFQSISEIRSALGLKASIYWNNHYTFGKKTDQSKAKITGRQFEDNLIINAIIPLIFAFGDAHKDWDKKELALSMMESMGPEKNAEVTKWKNAGLNIMNTSDTQGLIHMMKNYCHERRCLECAIGHSIIKSPIRAEVL